MFETARSQMDDEILFQGPGYTVARTHCAETLVPYGRTEQADGGVNHGWIDLRDQPGLVAHVPEARRSEGLAALLRAIATPASPLMSSACECGAFHQAELTEHARWQVGGFVTVMFRDAGMNADPQNLVDLAMDVLSGVAGSSAHHFGYEMIVEPLKSFFGREDCYALMLKPLGYGEDEAEAWAAFDFAASAAARSITERAL